MSSALPMEKVLTLFKRVGETPLECIGRFRHEHPEYSGEKMSYVGRLDPMAEGVLLVVVGEENKRRHVYLEFDKTYEAKFLFGISTDTHDILGRITSLSSAVLSIGPLFKEHVRSLVRGLVGEKDQIYPAYSSKTVDGKPLWQWAREGKIDQIAIPKRRITIYDADIRLWSRIAARELATFVAERIRRVHGDFRQELILTSWKEIADASVHFPVASAYFSCSSGTYVRALASQLTHELHIPVTAINIRRLSMGPYQISHMKEVV